MKLLPQKNPLFIEANRHLEWIKVRNYSKSTIDNRRGTLGFFCQWSRERGIDSILQLDINLINRYQKSLHYYRDEKGKSLSPSAQQCRLGGVRVFSRWLYKQKLIDKDACEDLVLPRLKKTLPTFLTLEEIEAVLSIPDITAPHGLRNRSILETLYSTGLRRVELCNLKLQDINLNKENLFVEQGKGKKDRLIPIGKRALFWVEKYLNEVRPFFTEYIDSEYLFIADNGTRFNVHHLGQIVKQSLLKAGIEKPGSCHLFRHTMATQMLEHGADIRYVQQMLGHTKLDTTQIYTHVTIQKLKEVHERCHPARLKKDKEEIKLESQNLFVNP